MMRDSIPPVSPEVEEAYNRVFRALKDVTRGMPKAKPFEEFMADLRSRGDDDVFTTENPGP